MIATRRPVPRGTQKSRSASVSAPIGGWNARDALGNMDPNDAVALENWFPGTNNVFIRKGYSEHTTGITGQVETLMTYSSGTASTLFAAATTKIYNVTAAGAVGAASLSSLTNARWQYVNFTTTGGSYLLCVNGADKMRIWDGSAWHADGDGAPYDVTNVDTATCANITVFKNRIWLIKTGTLKAWYLPINAIGGAATGLDMSSIAQLGGYLMAAMTWTLDAGYGVDDYLAFSTSEGEVMVWRLTDPTTPTGIALIGVWQIGAPIGRRCWTKYGGDLLIITQDGVVPMSGALQSSRTNPRVSITDKIQFATSRAITDYGDNFGWQLIDFPKGSQLLLNVPVATGSQQQFVQNNVTKSWCSYKGWAANCWGMLSDDIYFGGNGFVGHAWYTNADAGDNIDGTAIQSFQSYQGIRQKQCKMVRYHLSSDGQPSLYGNVNVDYDLSNTSAQLTASPISNAIWDVSVWDSGLWDQGFAAFANWEGATGIGYTFAPYLKSATNGSHLEWNGTDLVFEAGGII